MVIAHVKWFIQATQEVSPFSFYESSVWVWMLLVVLLLVAAGLLDRFLKTPPKSFLDFGKRTRSTWVYAFQVAVAASLVFAAVNQVILVPHFEATHWIVPAVEVGAAILLILNRWVGVAAVLLLLTYAFSILSYGFLEAADYLNLVGIAAFLYLEKPIIKAPHPWKDHALDGLRVLTGLALVVLAFSEKLLAPGKSLSFLADYDLNFMSGLGFHFSDRLFVLSAGSMELVFGLIMLLGWIPRINTIALAFFLISSNLYFFIQGHSIEAWTELFGHLPVIGTALLLILFGKTFKRK